MGREYRSIKLKATEVATTELSREETSASRGLFFTILHNFLLFLYHGWLISNQFTATVIGSTLSEEILNPTSPLLNPYVLSLTLRTSSSLMKRVISSPSQVIAYSLISLPCLRAFVP